MLIRVNVDNPGDKITEFGAGAKLYWARDNTSATGAFTDASGSVTLVATQTQYEIIDGTGAVGSYYRTRIGNSAGTVFDAWSDVFQAGAPKAYATVDALRELLQLPDDSRDNLLADLLVRVSEKIDINLGFDFYRHPAVSGTEVRLVDHNGSDRLIYQPGIVSLSQVRTAAYTGGTFSILTSTDWHLRLPAGPGGEPPYLAVRFGTYAPYGYDTVELTGVFGYPSIPAAIEQAALHWAADLYRVGAGGGIAGAGVGIEEFGLPRFLGGMPRIAWETLEDYRRRHTEGLLVA